MSRSSREPSPSTNAALASEQAGQGWQPIETAPRDRFVLLYTPARDEMDGFVAMAKWQTGSWYGVDDEGLTFNPLQAWDWTTHWMPLPAAPTPLHPETGQAADEMPRGLDLSFPELEDLHSAIAQVVTANERAVPDEEDRWSRLTEWLTKLAVAANERCPANWKGLPPIPSLPNPNAEGAE